MTHEEDVNVAQLAPAMGAGPSRILERRRLLELPSLPMRPLDRPRDDVLEAAEGRPAVAGGLIEPESVVLLDGRPTPRASQVGHVP